MTYGIDDHETRPRSVHLSPWNRLAPFLSITGASRVLDLPLEEVATDIRSKRIMGLLTTKGSIYIPESQFGTSADGELIVVDEVADILALHDPSERWDEWMFYMALTGPQEELDDRSILEAAHAKYKVEVAAELIVRTQASLR